MEARSIRDRLLAEAEPEYRDFSARLLPGVKNILGVRLPKLRRIAAQLASGDWRGYLGTASDGTFEEIMLQGMVIGRAPAETEELLRLTDRFLPKIDNWSVCDSFCSGFCPARRDPDMVWAFLPPNLNSAHEYRARFGAVMLLDYYVDGEHIDRVLRLLDSVRQGGYYAQMGVAWAVSVCYVKYPERTMRYLQYENTLDPATRQKALRKILESRRVGEADHRQIRALCRTLS